MYKYTLFYLIYLNYLKSKPTEEGTFELAHLIIKWTEKQTIAILNQRKSKKGRIQMILQIKIGLPKSQSILERTMYPKISTWEFLNLFCSILCIWLFCLQVCTQTMCIPGVQRGQKRASEPLDPMVVNYHVGERKQSCVLYKSNKLNTEPSLQPLPTGNVWKHPKSDCFRQTILSLFIVTVSHLPTRTWHLR